ncbi:hypothetical protein ACFX12_028520 [Malus domestica]
MDSYEATRIVFSRIQNLDPENASKIMGLLLIQDHGEKEMIRLAFGPEAFLHSVILKSRKELGVSLSSNSPSSPSTPSSPSPFTNPIAISRQNSCSSSSRLSLTIPNLSSSSASWAAICELRTQEEINSFYGGSNGGVPADVMDEFQLQEQLSFLNDGCPPPMVGPKSPDFFYPQSNLSSSPTTASDPNLFPSLHGSANWGGGGGGGGGPLHRRSCSVSDVCMEDPNSGFGWKPCLYFARGYCKNGASCRFLHSGGLGDAVVDGGGQVVVGSPSKLEMMDHEALLRSKTAQQQRLAAASQLMAASANSFPYSSKCMNFLLQQQQTDSQRAAAASLMMGDDMHKFSRSRLERTDFSMNGGAGIVNPASRQIYLTFPANSTFREEDVSNYFSMYGPVQDVRIPYQQKRMFGFVTFLYPETVKLILAKGNPHFVCDARVLVKPYKEKGKAHEKYKNSLTFSFDLCLNYSTRKQQQQVERGDLSPCGTPTGLDGRDPYDLQLGAKMFYNSQDMLWRRKLEEQADLQALEIQSRRLMGLQLHDVKKHHHHALSASSPIHSPTQSPNMFSRNIVLPSVHNGQEVLHDNCSSPMPHMTPAVDADQLLKEAAAAVLGKDMMANNDESGSGSRSSNGSGKESPHDDIGDLLEGLEHNLPDSPFASPTKAAGEYTSSAFPNVTSEANGSDASFAAANINLATSLLPASSSLDMASFKSFNCQIPRLNSGHGAIGMYAGTGAGPKCPVGTS